MNFNIRIHYANHFPADRGDMLKISLRGMDLGTSSDAPGPYRESVRPPENQSTGIRTIEFQSNLGEGPVLLIHFTQPVSYRVGQGADFQSVVVAIGSKESARACNPEFPRTGGASGSGPAFRDDSNARRLLAEAQDALTAGDPDRAIRSLTAIKSYPENPYSPQAQELLGVARQRKGDKEKARAEFEEYLRRYPEGDAAERVRQRLNALLTAEQAPKEKLGRVDDAASPHKVREDGPSVLNIGGSVSQVYTRDQGVRTVQDPTLPPVLNRDPADNVVYSDALISNVDFNAMWGNRNYKTKFRFAGGEEHDFTGRRGDVYSVSALFLETSVKDWNFMMKAGRQTTSTGGVLGRFDGAVASLGVMDGVKLSAVAGSPVASRLDMPFKDDKYFYGGSVTIGPLWKSVDLTLYAIQQEAQGRLDRQAVGTEFRYFDTDRNVFGAADYDVYFGEVNLAMINTSWTLPNKSVLSAAADYRRAPFMMGWNALISQPYGSLKELYQHYTRAQIDQLALDRTAIAKTATVGYSTPLSQSLQFSLDATWSNVSATGATGEINGNPAIPPGVSTGDEFYYSAQLTGSDLLSTGDIWVLGARYVDRQAADTYAIDMNVRYPITEDWRINPRVRLAYEKGPAIEDYQVQPSLLLDYNIAKNLTLELEGGAKWQWTTEGAANANEFEYYFMVGLRYDFHIDDALNAADWKSQLWRK